MILVGTHDDMALLADVEVAVAPPFDVVQRACGVDRPARRLLGLWCGDRGIGRGGSHRSRIVRRAGGAWNLTEWLACSDSSWVRGPGFVVKGSWLAAWPNHSATTQDIRPEALDHRPPTISHRQTTA